MPVWDLYSKRNKRNTQDTPDIFIYDEIPKKFRTQLIHLIIEGFGEIRQYTDSWGLAYKNIHNVLCQEYGVFTLSKINSTPQIDLFEFIMQVEDVDKILDVIEVVVENLRFYLSLKKYRSDHKIQISFEEIVSDLNTRLLENSLGYQYESNQIVRVDSKFIHQEIMKPALLVLANSEYEGANEEFLLAHEHYRIGEYKECLVDCLKSFESTMKIICVIHGWVFDPEKDTASKLIDICFENKLIPDYLQSQFGTLRTNLQCGIPTVRNKEAGHGQGDEIKTIPAYLASYLLHLTATSILLLTDAEKEIK